MTYAILNEEHTMVENIAESYIALNENWIQVPANVDIYIGDIFDGKMFYDPQGKMRVSPEIEQAQIKIKELEEDNTLKTAQIQALSDRNDFLEDCIAEMAGMLYA